MRTTPLAAELAYADALAGVNVRAIDAAALALPAATVWEI